MVLQGDLPQELVDNEAEEEDLQQELVTCRLTLLQGRLRSKEPGMVVSSSIAKAANELLYYEADPSSLVDQRNVEKPHINKLNEEKTLKRDDERPPGR